MVDDEGLDYNVMAQRALRGVLRDALSLVSERGLPGAHHFYITFRTDHPGAEVPARLRARYPKEMTIVLQNQFWGLEVEEERFAVTLSFNDLPERVSVPFQSVIAFADPSVPFGLQFDDLGKGGDDADKPAGEVQALPERKRGWGRKSSAEARPKAGKEADTGTAETPPAGDGDAGQAEVVPLDTFRKK
jgi:hypothetical protein